MATSQELYLQYKQAEEREQLERNRQAAVVRQKLDTGIFKVVHDHKQCLYQFRSGLSHILRISEVMPELTEHERELLSTWDTNRSGSYYFEGNKLSMYCGTCLFPPLWKGDKQYEPSDVTRVELLESELIGADWHNDWEKTIGL